MNEKWFHTTIPITSHFSIHLNAAVRGGISQCSSRYAAANNKYMEDYDQNLPTSYLIYFDVNSLYAYAMSQPIPQSEYQWITASAENIDLILNCPADSDYGYLVEADFNYPNQMHDLHNDYPFLCEKMRVNDGKHPKLILNLHSKTKYTLHYLTMQMAISKGLEMVKVHRILRFKQSQWLKPFIDFNTEKRKNAKNDFEKMLYKFFSNAVFGKSMENVRKRCEIKLINKWDGRYGAKVKIAKPNFKKITIFNENLVAIEMFKSEIKLNKPIPIGVCVLEISKLKMYDFHYNFMLREYEKENCRVMYTDTDSFIYFLKDKDIYEVIKNHPDQFDTSDFPVNNQYNIDLQNKKVYGLMKDENNGHVMKKFVGLRAKMYCFMTQDGGVCKRAKGVKKSILKKKLNFEQYYNCLFNTCSITHKQSIILSAKHKLYSVCLDKKMLDPFDDKRIILENNIDTLAYGHYSASK